MKQILSLDVPTLRPRNPLVAALRLQRAGPHAASVKSRRQRAERALQHELDRLRTHRPPAQQRGWQKSPP